MSQNGSGDVVTNTNSGEVVVVMVAVDTGIAWGPNLHFDRGGDFR